MTEKEEGIGFFSKWMEPAMVTGFLMVLFYATGWSYAYHYFRQFHTGVANLSLKTEYVFMCGFWAIRENILVFLIIILAIFLFYWIYLFAASAKSAGRFLRAIRNVVLFLIIPLVIFVLFLSFYNLGKTGAAAVYAKEALGDFGSYNSVRIDFKPEARPLFADMTADMERGCYRLLLETKDRIYVFRPVKGGGLIQKIATREISTQAVLGLARMPWANSCPP